MITNKKELFRYIYEDRVRSSRPERPFYICDEIRKYLYLLRKNEYFDYLSQKNKIFLIPNLYYKYRHHKLGIKLGWEIPVNVFGPGVTIDHWGFLAVSGQARIGKHCHIYGDVTIGVKNEKDKRAPVIGDNVTIGAGARIIGNVKIASGVTIGANAVVTRDVLKENSIVAGVPAKYIHN